MADSKLSKEIVGDDVSGQQTFAVSEKRLENLCHPCRNADKKTSAKNWCLDCSEYLCSDCSKIHLQFTISRDHKIVPESQSDECNVSYDMKGLDHCKEHNKLLEFICEDDDMLCCRTCAIVKHRKCHNVVDIEKKAEENAIDLASLRRDLLDIESKAKAYAQHLMNILENLTTGAIEISNKIKQMQDKIIKMFENLKRNVAKEIASFQQNAYQELDMKYDVCNECVSDVAETLSYVDNFRRDRTLAQQLIMAYHIKDKIATLKKKTNHSELKDVHMSFDFDKSINLPPENDLTPGKLTMKYVYSDVTTIINIMNSYHKDQNMKMSLLASADLRQCGVDAEETLYAGMDFLPDGRLVVVDSKITQCLVYNQMLEKVGFALLPVYPYDVCVMSDEDAAVSGGTEIYLIKISKSSEVTVTRSLNVTVNCYSICMMRDENFLLGCFDDPKPVRVVSIRGEKRKLPINFHSKQYKVNGRTCTYIKNRNKVAVSDRFAHTVYIYDVANNTRVDVKDELIIQKPLGVAVGPADCIFVCSQYTHSIVQISHTGQILSHYVLDMCNPHSVCVSKDNTRLAVYSTADGTSKLFNIKMSKFNQVLQIEPAGDLYFQGPFTEVVTTYLKLLNPSEKKVCFRVRTTVPNRYCVRPNKGVIESKTSLTVALMLQPFEFDPNENVNHKFMVQAMFAPGVNLDSPELLWKDVLPDQLMESRLKCVLDPYSNSTKL